MKFPAGIAETSYSNPFPVLKSHRLLLYFTTERNEIKLLNDSN